MNSTEVRLLAHELPYPIARAVCAIDAEPAAADERRLLQVLYALESLMQLVGAAVLLDLYEQSPAVRNGAGDNLTGLDHPTLGAWCHLLTAESSKAAETFFPELANRRQELIPLLERLCNERNQLSHPTHLIDPARARRDLPLLRIDFNKLIGQFAFLREYHLVGIFDTPQPISSGQRVRAISLRGRTISSRELLLHVQGGVARGDVILFDPTATRGIVLHPFHFAHSDGDARDLLAFTRVAEGAKELTCYRISRPSEIHPIDLPEDENGRAVSPESWIRRARGKEAVLRRSLRVTLADTSSPLVDHRRLRSGVGAKDLPLRNLRHFRDGSTSKIYLGEDPASGQTRALKVPVDPDNRSVRQHFEREYRLLQKEVHPNVIRAYAAHDVSGVGFVFVTEFFDAPTLDEVLQGGPLDPNEAEHVLRALLETVAALHAQSPPIIHRDLKPANLLYRRADRALRVIDLGIARELGGTRGGTHTFGAGTPWFMPPEQFEGESLTTAADVYAVGRIALCLFQGVEALRQGRKTSYDGVPARLVSIVEKALRWEPGDRFASGGVMSTAIEQTADAQPAQEARIVPREGSEMTRELVGALILFERRASELRATVGRSTSVGETLLRLSELYQLTDADVQIIGQRYGHDLSLGQLASSRGIVVGNAPESPLAGVIVGAAGGMALASSVFPILGPAVSAVRAFSDSSTRKAQLVILCDDAINRMQALRERLLAEATS